ncbi:MAG: molybdopterin-dependent oxidoreductase [Pseudomonadales bacterium]|nr:molybdopterin-dependent oxidoreductase [Pseudomonadales bacterium]
MPEIKHTFCRVCEPSCALIAEVENDEIVALKPDRDHPVTRGFACHKGLAVLEMHKDPDRLNYPLKRGSNGPERVSWDEAAEGIAARLAEIKDKYGPDALGSYTGNPLAFNALAGPAISSFLLKNGVRRNFSSGTQDCTNKFAGGEAVFGSSTIHPLPDIDNTDFLLIFGANPRISHMSFISIADPMKALRSAANRGAKVRFVDPRINESVKGIGEIVQVNPDTDVWLMAAMLHHLDVSGRFDEKTIKEHGEHIDELRQFISRYPADRVASVVGISADEIRKLADEFADADRAAVYMSTGVNMGRQGTLAYWLLFMLSFVTGNLDQPGGNIYSLGFYPAAKAGRVAGENPFFDSPFGEMRKIRGSLPGNLMADMILAEENPIRGLIVISGNPVLSVGGGEKLRRAFEKLEFLLVIDIYPNATAEFADYVLPATDMYERADINMCGLGMQHQPYVQYTSYIVPPTAERKPEWWILGRLEQAQGLGEAPDLHDIDAQFGRINHMLRQSDTSIDEIRQAPHQTEVLPASRAGRFYTDWIQTESRRVDCCPGIFTEALQTCEQLFLSAEAESGMTLKMISRRTNYMLNSWFHNLPSLKRPSQLTNPIYMHPEDARARNLGEGSEARIFNDFGDVTSVVALDETLKPGTVAMTHGWGQQNTGMSVARQHPGVNANALLPSGPGSYEKLSNQAFMTGIPVSIEACA